ncbi:zinc-binding dehydrogenase [candidate division KSB1 bacterium]|nr:zinc-binding dehydrogenase [candidate division KSB1 bacterium]
MLALVKTKKGPGNLELMEMPEPKPQAGEVLIRVHVCGVCGTDIHVLHDRFPYWPPVILGHEFAGEIVEIGADVNNFKVGDRVVGEPHTQACGKCTLCRTGNIQICPMKRSPGWGIHGGMAPFLKMPEMLLHKIPENISWEEAALIEPLANTVHDIIERAKIYAGDFVSITGPGPIGLLAALVCKAAGARGVMLIGTGQDEAIRLKKARELGIDRVINLEREDPVQAALEMTDGAGIDLAIDASGAAPAIALAVELIRKKGRICAIGLTSRDKIEFPWDKAMFKVADLFFNLSTSYTSWETSIRLVASGRIQLKPLISHARPLSEWESVFKAIEELKVIKAVLLP